MLLSGPLTMMIRLALETDERTQRFAVLLAPGRARGDKPEDEPAGEKPGA
jgi:hypothetical protein